MYFSINSNYGGWTMLSVTHFHSFLKKLIVTTSLAAMAISVNCAKNLDPVGLNQPENTKVQTYIYDDVNYNVKFTNNGDSSVPIDDEVSRKVKDLLDQPNCGLCPDPSNESITYIYLNKIELGKITSKIHSKSNLAKNQSSKYLNAEVEAYAGANATGVFVNFHKWDTNTLCLTQNVFDNVISSIYWYNGTDGVDYAVCYESCGESGKSFVLWCPNHFDDLHSICMKIKWWWCDKTWNDNISQIVVYDL